MKASKEIEKEFHLVEALSKARLRYEIKPVNDSESAIRKERNQTGHHQCTGCCVCLITNTLRWQN